MPKGYPKEDFTVEFAFKGRATVRAYNAREAATNVFLTLAGETAQGPIGFLSEPPVDLTGPDVAHGCRVFDSAGNQIPTGIWAGQTEPA